MLKSKKVKLVLQVNEDDRVMRDGVLPVEEGRGLSATAEIPGQGTSCSVLYIALY